MGADGSAHGTLNLPDFLKMVRKFEAWARDDETLLDEVTPPPITRSHLHQG